MNPKELRIVYMGTPDFAVEPLRRLVEGGYSVVAVVTTPDKPAGRGQKLSQSAVKEYALSQGLPLLQPEKLRNDEFLEKLRDLNPDLGIVVAFRMLPEVVWSMPRFGTFNLHASLLPQYRGAAPINRAIMNGERETGVTTFMLDRDIDTGDIIAMERTPIADDETAGSLHDRLMDIGAALVLRTVDMIASGKGGFAKQQTAVTVLKTAPKIFKEDCQIDWNNDLDTIYNKVRGLSPAPSAWFGHNGINYKVFTASKEPAKHDRPAGEVASDGKSYIKVACEGGFLYIEELQAAGKKRMKTKDFLLGNKL